MPDLVGIGSINVDLIVASTGADGVDLGDPRLGLAPADVGNERAVSPSEIDRALAYLDRFGPVVSPGGSALNVAAGVAATGAPVTVGHVGVLGIDEPPGSDLRPWFDRLGIDRSLVGEVEGPPGICLSITRGLERTLLTTGGANDQLGRWLAQHRHRIAPRLRTARLVHVTSLAGLDDLDPLVDLLDHLRAPSATGTGPRLSCDPGAIWTAADRPASADRIMSRCHQLLVNRRERDALGGPTAILDRWAAVELVVVKGAEAIEVHHRDRPVERHPNPRVLTPGDIIDDTGAGDAFAAGFLIGQLVPEIGPDRGVTLGMDLARAKLGFTGMSDPERLAPVLRRHLAGG